MQKKQVVDIVLSCLQQTILNMEENNEAPVDSLNESTSLLGRRSVIDSMGLVTLLVNIEQKITEDHRITITIADERAMSQEKSPFLTVQSLSDYTWLLIEDQRRNG
jgi:hypothetical protein